MFPKKFGKVAPNLAFMYIYKQQGYTYHNSPGKKQMTRLVAIIIIIAAGYFIIRYIIRTLKQGLAKESGTGDRRYQGWNHVNTEEGYRQILGVTSKDSPATIRRKYKELLSKYHPDKVQHLGTEFQEMAEMKTKAIMEAYEFFRKKYNL